MAKFDYIYGRLGYNSSNDRYGLLESDLWVNDGFHCGEPLEVKVNGKWVETTMEMLWDKSGSHWFLTETNYIENLEYIQARIKRQVY